MCLGLLGILVAIAAIKLAFTTIAAEKAKYKEMIGKNNDLVTDVDTSYPDQLITLATCSYHVGDGCGRYLLIGKRI